LLENEVRMRFLNPSANRLAAALILAVLSTNAHRAAADPPKASSRSDATKHSNRLSRESSLYLRMHAHNPVDWFPWGEEALAKAKNENKVIFLSIGYSSCYWCHVMERESFMDAEIAEFVNKNFVCIKVDREERPDLDAIYMLAVQIRSGRGGWPMTVFLTPDAKPFFGGTYFPARDGDRPGSPGFLTIAQTVQRLWQEKPQDIAKDAETITRIVQQELGSAPPSVEPSSELVASVVQSLSARFDSRFGGFGFDEADPRRPKFPEPSNLLFLAKVARESNDETAKNMLVKTLGQMAMGGIWDHVGGGFHRYSTDRFWRIPHFEKMLYDNGQLLSVYAEAYELTKDEGFRRIISQTVEYMIRELAAPGGAFFAAMDAESEQVEGKFYRWTAQEVKDALNKDYELFAEVYGFNDAPNFEEEFYVPQLKTSLASVAAAQGISEKDLWSKLVPLQAKLLAVRNQRIRPVTDNKVLTSWNGLAIRGLADAGRILHEPQYVEAARQATIFVLARLRTPEGRLLRTFTDGNARLNGYLDDYAFLVDGLLALHRATDEPNWLQAAEQLTDKQIELFHDSAGGGFYFTSKDHEALVARGRTYMDNVLPAGNSVSADNLLRLARAAKRPEYLTIRDPIIRSATSLMQKEPAIAPRMAMAISDYLMKKPAP
jgi:uncharacterized protein YyaL (SSP411 family)